MTEADAMVFVVDDDTSLRESLKNLIRSVGLRVEAFASAQEFLRSKRPNVPSCLVLDVRLPGQSGLDFQAELAREPGCTWSGGPLGEIPRLGAASPRRPGVERAVPTAGCRTRVRRRRDGAP